MEQEDAVELKSKLAELEDEGNSFASLAVVIDSTLGTPLDKVSEKMKAQIGADYIKLKDDIKSSQETEQSSHNKMAEDYGKIQAIVKAKMADVNAASEKEDYASVKRILDGIYHYNLNNREIDDIRTAVSHAEKGKDLLAQGNLEEGIPEYQSAESTYHLQKFEEILNGSKEKIASVYYSKGIGLLDKDAKTADTYIKALDFLNKAKFYKDPYRDTDLKINVAKHNLTNVFVANAKKYESAGKWGCAALERLQAVKYDSTRSDPQIDSDLGKLKMGKALKLVFSASSHADLSPSTVDFSSKVKKGIASSDIFASLRWQMVKGDSAGSLASDIEKNDYDLTVLPHDERALIDLAAFVSVDSFDSDGPNKDESEMSKSVIINYHTEQNPAHQTWADSLESAQRTLAEAKRKEDSDTDQTVKNIDAISVITAQIGVTAVTLAEPEKTIKVPDYGDAIWQEINWDETVCMIGEVVLVNTDAKGNLIQTSIPINETDKEKCKEIHGRRYADKAGIVDAPKNLLPLSQVKQTVVNNALTKTGTAILDALQKKGFEISMDRLNNAIAGNADDAVDYIVYIALMYPSIADMNKLQSMLNEIHQGYTLNVKQPV